MSHIPGYELEDVLSDIYGIFDKDGNHGSSFVRSWNKSSQGEIYSDYTFISNFEFGKFVSFFESIRDRVEFYLQEYDEEESGSWRDYKYSVIADLIPDEMEKEAIKYLKTIKQ